jgi:hypothetical protein
MSAIPWFHGLVNQESATKIGLKRKLVPKVGHNTYPATGENRFIPPFVKGDKRGISPVPTFKKS